MAAFASACLLAATPPALAQDEDGDGAKGAEAKDKDEKSYAEIAEACERLDGLFPLLQDRETGVVYLEVAPAQLGKEFIHFSHTADGIPSLGLFRGQFGTATIFTITRQFENLEFTKENSAFHFDPDSALSRAADANISPAVLANEKIVAEDEASGRLLVKADPLFLQERFRQIKPSPPEDEDAKKRAAKSLKLGDLDKDLTRFTELKNYPENTVLRVAYVFENPYPVHRGEADVTDARSIRIRVQHTLIEVPENDYRPRFDDPRVGYFTTQVTDLTSADPAPYRDLIHRWHLQRKPDSKEPVEPIVWWMENTTPGELREPIRRAALRWNEAFESAGFENAVEVRQQPDDADWDAGDIRYNVLRWTSSPDAPFGGYGPSFVNPRTGQIIGADIMLEYVFVTNRVRMSELVPAAENTARIHPAGVRLLRAGGKPAALCGLTGHMTHNNRFGRTALAALDAPPVEVDRLLDESLAYLILHEIGHTLGLNHNFRASQLHSPAEIHERALTEESGLTSSVMDYPAVNFSAQPDWKGNFYTTRPGPYDHWAIAFACDPELADPFKLEAHLARSTRPELAFANDADDMRSTGRGVDPRAMIGDLSSDPIGYAVERIGFVTETLPKLPEKVGKEGDSYQTIRSGFSTLMREYRNAARVLSRHIGGVRVERAVQGQPDASDPFQAVPGPEQIRAAEALAAHVFAPGALAFPPELLRQLQMQRRGFDFFDLDDNEDPKPHERIAQVQNEVLDQLLHRHTLQRILDSELYGNAYELSRMLGDLDTAIMEGEAAGERPDTFRQRLQLDYLRRLVVISGLNHDDPTKGSDYPAPAQSETIALLLKHQKELEAQPPEQRSPHQLHLLMLLERALATK